MAVMQEIQPEMQRIQKKYENKKDQASQVKMQQEMMELYKKYNYMNYFDIIYYEVNKIELV